MPIDIEKNLQNWDWNDYFQDLIDQKNNQIGSFTIQTLKTIKNTQTKLSSTQYQILMSRIQMVLLIKQIQSLNRFANQIETIINQYLNDSKQRKTINFDFVIQLHRLWGNTVQKLPKNIELETNFDHLEPASIMNFDWVSCDQIFQTNFELQTIRNTLKFNQCYSKKIITIHQTAFIKYILPNFKKNKDALYMPAYLSMIYIIQLRRYLKRIKHRLIENYKNHQIQPMEPQLANWLCEKQHLITTSQYQKLIQT